MTKRRKLSPEFKARVVLELACDMFKSLPTPQHAPPVQ
jgi:hypothetical protein